MKKRKSTKKEITALKKWLENNNATKLAVHLGYKDRTTIFQWVYRESIPFYIIEDVMEFIQ